MKQIILALICLFSLTNCEYLFRGNVDPLLFKAVMDKNLDLVKSLVEKGADVNAITSGRSDLLAVEGVAVKSNVAKVTVDKGETVLMMAAKQKDFPMVKYLVSKGADINAASIVDFTPLIYSAWYNSYEITEFFIKKGAKINIAASYPNKGYTALRFASEEGNIRVTELLLKNGAEHSIEAIFYIADSDLIEMLKILAKHKAPFNKEDKYGRLPLHETAKKAKRTQIKIMEVLLNGGANIDLRDRDGKTALMYAASDKSGDNAVRFLLHNGADVKIKDDNDYDALVYARLGKNNTSIDLIQEKTK